MGEKSERRSRILNHVNGASNEIVVLLPHSYQHKQRSVLLEYVTTATKSTHSESFRRVRRITAVSFCLHSNEQTIRHKKQEKQ